MYTLLSCLSSVVVGHVAALVVLLNSFVGVSSRDTLVSLGSLILHSLLLDLLVGGLSGAHSLLEIGSRSTNNSSLVLDGLSSSVSRDKLILHLLVTSSPSLGPG